MRYSTGKDLGGSDTGRDGQYHEKLSVSAEIRTEYLQNTR
jgi:hypothetical protein